MFQRCRVCGCTDAEACPLGCWWVEVDLCSSCVGAAVKCATCGKSGMHACLDVERSDWERSPGRNATLRIGIVTFGANTADGGRIGFSIEICGWGFVWSLGTLG